MFLRSPPSFFSGPKRAHKRFFSFFKKAEIPPAELFFFPSRKSEPTEAQPRNDSRGVFVNSKLRASSTKTVANLLNISCHAPAASANHGYTRNTYIINEETDFTKNDMVSSRVVSAIINLTYPKNLLTRIVHDCSIP